MHSDEFFFNIITIRRNIVYSIFVKNLKKQIFPRLFDIHPADNGQMLKYSRTVSFTGKNKDMTAKAFQEPK